MLAYTEVLFTAVVSFIPIFSGRPPEEPGLKYVESPGSLRPNTDEMANILEESEHLQVSFVP